MRLCFGKTYFLSCAGGDSDWHHLEPVTCWQGHAQRVEGGRGVKSRLDRPAAHLIINLLVVQMNACVYSNMLLCPNKLSLILLIIVSSFKLCELSAYTSYHYIPQLSVNFWFPRMKCYSAQIVLHRSIIAQSIRCKSICSAKK